MQYIVIGPDGQRYGPVDEEGLKVWATEGRLGSTTWLESVDGSRVAAGSLFPELFKGDQFSPYPRAGYGTISEPARTSYGTMSLIFGILSVVTFCCFLFSLPLGVTAIAFGIAGLKQRDRVPAIIGISLGSIACLITVWMIVGGAVGDLFS